MRYTIRIVREHLGGMELPLAIIKLPYYIVGIGEPPKNFVAGDDVIFALFDSTRILM